MFDWLQNNLIYLTKAGSVAYGVNTDKSDLDIKGIFIPPKRIENHLFEHIEQIENNKEVETLCDQFKNPKNPKLESTCFSLKKFMVLASQINPNIIELLWTDDIDHIIVNSVMKSLIENRNIFLSSRVKFSFGGYAYSQLARINRHKQWIVKGELTEPKREDFGLPATKPKQLDEIFGYIKSEVERYNLSKFELDEMDRNDLKETLMELVNSLVKTNDPLGWDNWPDKYSDAVIYDMTSKFDLKDEVVDLICKEKEYKKALNQYNSWIKWKAERNPARRELEVKSGYDTKHASHLVRLMRMGYEILTEGKVIVKRPDRDEILSIKNGAWTYEQVMEFSDTMQKKLDEAYKTTKLSRSVDNEKVNALYYDMVNEYWNLDI